MPRELFQLAEDAARDCDRVFFVFLAIVAGDFYVQYTSRIFTENDREISVSFRNWIETFEIAAFSQTRDEFRAVDRIDWRDGSCLDRDLKDGFPVADRASPRELLALRRRTARHDLLGEVRRHDGACIGDPGSCGRERRSIRVRVGRLVALRAFTRSQSRTSRHQ